jgi:hypothetical protein
MKKTRFIETACAILTIDENGIGHQFFKDNAVLDIPEQEKLLVAIIKITENKPTPFVTTAGNNVIVTKEARNNAISLEPQYPVSASAIVVQNLAYRLIADFYIKVQKPKTPYKVFTDKDSAYEWCKQFLKK